MSTPDENPTPTASGEELFVRKALANVERAAWLSRIKNIVVTVIAFPVLYYLTGSAPEHKMPFTVIMVIGVMLAVITSKLTAQANSNTRAILQAIAALPKK